MSGMSLSCLLCPGSESDHEQEPYGSSAGINPGRCRGVDRSWSGGLTPPPYEHLRSSSRQPTRLSTSSTTATAGEGDKGRRRGHRKISSMGSPLLGGIEVRAAAEEPRLVRSRGMRRDWSFEDLRDSGAAMRDPTKVYA